MSDFTFNIESELAGIRGLNKKSKARDTLDTKNPQQESSVAEVEGESTETPLLETREPKEQQIAPQQQEQKPEQEQKTEGSSSNRTDFVNWKQFKILPGIFEHVIGGDRPIQLHPNIQRVQVSGIPKPMFQHIQNQLQKQYVGGVVYFPWGEYVITERNRVFTTKASLVRYLLFDSFRDASGTHVQYAKQWLALQHPAFDVVFNPNQLNPSNDELDIYALLYVSHTRALERGEYAESNHPSDADYETSDRIGMLNKRMDSVLNAMQAQEKAFEQYASRNHMLQTVLLLDRMGLLKGGLPKDVGEFVRVLEVNRDALKETGSIVDTHIEAEQKRQATIDRQKRMRAK